MKTETIGWSIVFLLLGAFFVWVMLSMAAAGDAGARLIQMMIGMLVVTVGAGVIYVIIGALAGDKPDDGKGPR